jgi:hypothetical protein
MTFMAKVKEALNILHGKPKARCTRKKYRKLKHWFNKECMQKTRDTRETLKKRMMVTAEMN